MGRRSPSKNKTSQNRAPIAHRSSSLASEITTPGTLAATLDSVNAPRLEPITTEEQSSPTKNVLRSPTKPLSNQLSTLQQEKEALDNKLWETTVELQEHIQQKKADDSQISRLQSELNKLKSDHEMEFEYLESLKSREAELQAALQSANSLATQEKKSFLEKLESRDEYIEGLQEQIEGYRSKVRSLTQSMASKHQESAAQLSVNTDNSNSSLNADTSIELNFDGSKIPNTPGSSELLSAGRQKRQLITLRNQLQKQRLENHRLRKQVAELNGNPEPSLDSIDSDPESIIESHDTTSTSILGAPELNFSGGFALSDDMVNLDELGQEKIQETQQPEIPETLHSQARAFNHALVPLAEYEELSSREPVRENSIDFEELKRLAAQLNFSVMPNEEFEHINRLLHGDKSIKTQVESHVLQDLVRQNTIEIRSPSRKLANDSSYTADEIAAAAASLGLAILPAKQLERLQSDIQKLHTHQPPAAAEVAQIAKLAGLQVIPENPTVDELRQVISDDVVLVERDVYEALEKPGPATLTRLASTYNLVVMPKSEVEQLRAQLKNHGSTNETTDADNTNSNDLVSVSDLSNTALREAAEKKNLVVLSAEDYQKMLSIRSSRDFNNLPMAERTDFFEKLIRSQGSASSSPSSRQSPSSFGTMADRAGRMGLVLVTKDEYTQLKQSQEMYNPTKADVIKSAKEHGLATMPMDEYSKLRATKWSSPNKTKSTESSPSKPKTTDTKEEDEFKAVPAVYLRALQRIAENPSLTDIESIAKKAGVHIVESSESQAVILAKAEEYGLSQPLSDEELLEKAKLLGLVEPLSLVKILDIAATNGWAPILPRDDLISKAKEFGLIEPPTENTYRREARKLGLIDPTDEEELIERARSLGFVHKPSEQETVEEAKRLGLVAPLTDEEIIERAKSLGLVNNPTESEVLNRAKALGLVDKPSESNILDEAKRLGLVAPLTDDEIIERAKSLGLVNNPTESDVLNRARALGLVDKPSESNIRDEAKRLGLVAPLTDDEIIERAKSLGLVNNPTESEVLNRAKALGLVDKPSESNIRDEAKRLGLVAPLTDDEIIERAKSLGLVNNPTESDVLNRARALGLVDKPSESNIRDEAKRLGLVAPLTDDEIIERAKSLGLVNNPTESDVLNRARALGLVDKPSESNIRDEAKRLGLVAPLTDDEIIERAKSLGLVNNPTESDVLNRARALGLVDKPSESNIRDEAKRLGLVAPLTDDEIIERAKSLGLVNNPTESEVLNRAKALGLVDKPSESNIRDEAKRLGLVAPLTDDEIIERAKSLGLVNNPTESEVLNRAKALGLVDKPSESNIRDEAKRLGLVAPLTNDEIIERAKTLGLVSKPTEKEIIDRAKTLGLVEKPSEKNVIDKAKRLGLVAPLTDDGIIERAKTLGLVSKPTESEVIDHAKTLGLVKSPTDDEIIKQAKTLGLVTPLTGDEVIQRAKTLGLVDKPSEKNIIDEAKHLGLVPPLTGEDVIERSKALGMIRKPTENEVISHAKALGLVERPSEKNIRYEAKRLGLVEPLTDSEVMERAKTLGLIERPSEKNILDQAKLLGLATPLTDDEIIKRAKSLGLVDKPSKQNTLDEAKNLGLITPPTDDDIIQMAQNLGLSTPLTDNEIIERAKNLGMTDIRSEYEHSKSVVLVDKLDDNQPGTNSKSPMLSAKDSKNSRGGHSAKLQFESSDQKLAESRPEYSKSKPDSEENSGTSKHHNVAEAKKRDSNQSKLDYEPQDTSTRLNLESEEADVFLTKDRPSKVAAASIAPRQLSNHYKSSKAPSSVHEESKLSDSSQDTAVHASHDTKKGADDREAKLPHKYSVNIRRTNTNSSLSREHNILSTPSAPREHNIAMQSRNTPRTTHRRVDSQSTGSDIDVLGLPMPGTIGGSGAGRKNTGLSENTLSTWSLKSLSSDDIGQFLAQVIMGEVLYKYYGGLNFEGITGGRHRRYFWFRPETRLLYWNRENPQILGYGNPRSITVVQVDEQIDRNPLPAGLFHRTLIIKGIERDIRVTCSTQSRHYVWLMTLRHVLSQNKNSS